MHEVSSGREWLAATRVAEEIRSGAGGNPQVHDVLVELVVVMAVSVGAALLLRRLRLPPVVGFLIAGVVVGPGGLGLVTDRNTIVGVAEVGVILLLFTVGLKLKISELWRMRVTVFGSGTA